jgi:hypothetical protein
MVNKSWVKIEFDKYSEFTSLKKNYLITKFNFIYIYIYIYSNLFSFILILEKSLHILYTFKNSFFFVTLIINIAPDIKIKVTTQVFKDIKIFKKYIDLKYLNKELVILKKNKNHPYCIFFQENVASTICFF